jgi:hypothetical protein
MSDLNAAPAADAAPGPIDYQPPALSQDEISLDDAVRLWNEPPKKKPEAESADEPATAEPESPAQAEDADQETDPGETQTQADDPAEELPPIEPPRSWTKEEKEAFAKWPREAQESTARVASAREAEFRRSQNEIAEQKKVFEAKLSKIDEVVAGYKVQDDAYEKETLEKFPNIKSQDDLDFLTNEMLRASNEGDTARSSQIQAYLSAFQMHNQKWAGIRANRANAEQLRNTERQTQWAKFTKDESDAFENDVPEFKSKKDEYTKRAAEVLSQLGFSPEELDKLASGQEKIALFDRRMQRLLFDRIKLTDIQASVPKAAPKNLPHVQRPGTRAPAGAAAAQDLKTLNQKLTATGSIDDAMALLMGQRKAS